MRVPAFWICLCLLCALPVTSASADQKANALLRQVETTLAKAHSFKAEAISLGTAKPEVSTLRILRPGYYALVEGAKGERQIIMNWKGEMMTYDESEAAHTKTLNLPARPVWLRQVQVNALLTPGDFVFTPPPIAKKTNSDDPVLQSPPCNALAPPFSMPGADGETLTLAALLKGKKALLLNFTFGECQACVLEIPALKRLYADLKDKGLAVVAVNILDNRETAQKFIAKYQLPYPMGLDAKAGGGTEEVVAHYRVGDGGTNILIGADGRILWHETGLNERYLRCVLEQAGIPALSR